MVDRGIPGRQAQRIGRHLQLIGSTRVDQRLEARLLLGELVEVGVGLRVRGVHFVEALLRRRGLAHPLFDRIAHRLSCRQLRLLLEKADADARHPDHFAVVIVIDARHYPQQA